MLWDSSLMSAMMSRFQIRLQSKQLCSRRLDPATLLSIPLNPRQAHHSLIDLVTLVEIAVRILTQLRRLEAMRPSASMPSATLLALLGKANLENDLGLDL